MDKLELLYDHYKETYEILTHQIKQRDKMFVLSFIFSCVALLFAFDPAEYRNLLFGYIYDQFSIDLSSQFFVLQTFLWIVLLYVTLRYSQAFVNIERTYSYLDSLERKIHELSQAEFDREGGHYARNFSLPSKYANYVYKFIFPVISVMIAVVKIISECHISAIAHLLFVDFIICFAYILLWIFHVIYVVKTNG